MSIQPPPEALKQLKPYLTLASQLEQKGEKIVAYYCRLYSVQTGMSINRTAPECKKYLAHIMDILETSKKQLVGDEAITSDVVGQAIVEKYALRIFEKADDDDRQSRFSKNLVKQFYSAGLLFDILNCFGELSEDLVVKKQYAKRKAMYLNKCFQTGETPIPGPLVNDGLGDEGFEGEGADFGGAHQQSHSSGVGGGGGTSGYYDYGAGASGGAAASNNNSPVDRPASSSRKQPPSAPQYHDTAAYNQSNTVDIQATHSTEFIEKAQKLCKFASSALQYDDIDTAIKNLEQCLSLLKATKK